MSIIELIQAIRNSKMKYVCWTGGEPLLWKWEIEKVIEKTRGKHHHLETNGDLLSEEDFLIFQYLAISPKDKATAKKCRLLYRYEDSDIKVVTNLKTVGTDMLVYATMLMPLTTYKKKKDLEIMKNVWVYCCEFNKRYCARIHYFVWGKKKGV
jgi:organic radical activating enzyme